MLTRKPKNPSVLNLRAGEIVEVCSREEILSTLDKEGKLDALPFMPEMLKHCGERVKVFKRAHKTCDTIDYTGARRMTNAVHLEGVRCDGEAHGGCQAGCLIFWKEAWLKRVGLDPIEETVANEHELLRASNPNPVGEFVPSCSEATLMKATRAGTDEDGSGEETFSCQATELREATSPLAWWDIRQYITDIRSGNVGIGEILRAILFWMFTKTLKLGAYKAQIWMFNRIQQLRGGSPYPFKHGNLTKTPSTALNLQPGELVQVKTQDEILLTVNRHNRNRGLSFDAEMVGYCGGQFRVLRRVDKVINEKTGKMIKIQNDCIILEGVTCKGQYSNKRLFCPRDSYHFLREIWLKRIT